jgi:hypothetical protein
MAGPSQPQGGRELLRHRPPICKTLTGKNDQGQSTNDEIMAKWQKTEWRSDNAYIIANQCDI